MSTNHTEEQTPKQSLNIARTPKTVGIPKWLWANPPGRPTHISKRTYIPAYEVINDNSMDTQREANPSVSNQSQPTTNSTMELLNKINAKLKKRKQEMDDNISIASSAITWVVSEADDANKHSIMDKDIVEPAIKSESPEIMQIAIKYLKDWLTNQELETQTLIKESADSPDCLRTINKNIQIKRKAVKTWSERLELALSQIDLAEGKEGFELNDRKSISSTSMSTSQRETAVKLPLRSTTSVDKCSVCQRSAANRFLEPRTRKTTKPRSLELCNRED